MKRDRKMRASWVLAVLVILGFLVLWSGRALFRGRTPQGINCLERVTINGVKQWVSIRGSNRSNPVLLFLHGGPGSANIALLRQQAPALEQHFVVVNWDQRGAGKSFNPLASEPLTLQTMQADLHALVEQLKTRFGVDQVMLVGFSWGTVLGLGYTAEHPENVSMYIAISQLVNGLEGEQLSLEYTRSQAQVRADAKGMAALETIDPAVYSSAEWLQAIQTQRKWLLRYGGVYHTRASYAHEVWSIICAPEYSLLEFALWPLGSSRSLKQLYPEVLQVNFFENVQTVQAPVYFLAGRHDFNTPTELVVQYYKVLDAPAGKELVWFEASAHGIPWDEPHKLQQTIIDLAR